VALLVGALFILVSLPDNLPQNPCEGFTKEEYLLAIHQRENVHLQQLRQISAIVRQIAQIAIDYDFTLTKGLNMRYLSSDFQTVWLGGSLNKLSLVNYLNGNKECWQ
jgi:UDP-N-acetylglucosamine 2-epimerase